MLPAVYPLRSNSVVVSACIVSCPAPFMLTCAISNDASRASQDEWRFVTIRKTIMFQFGCEDKDDLYTPKAPITSPYTRIFITRSSLRRHIAETMLLDFVGDMFDENFELELSRCRDYLKQELVRCSNVEDLYVSRVCYYIHPGCRNTCLIFLASSKVWFGLYIYRERGGGGETV